VNPLKWLHSFSAGEREILELLIVHVELSLSATRFLDKVVSELMAGDPKTAYFTYMDIDKAETEADHVHRRLVEMLSTGVFFSNLGTDFMNLAEKVDGVADSAKTAGKIITQRRLEASELAPIGDKVKEHLAVTVKAVSSLREAIETLSKRNGELLRYAREVEEYEEVADSIRDTLVELVFTLKVSILSVLQLRDFIDMVDNVSDNAEDASDVLHVLVSKGYS
jgi:predicted phosphate transport protein (TIGR00153 family)